MNTQIKTRLATIAVTLVAILGVFFMGVKTISADENVQTKALSQHT